MALSDLTPAEQVEYEILTKTLLADRDRELCRGRGGLMNFIRLMWKVIEPERPLVEGWVLRAICEHLEAITFGDITRLLINVPPGSTKSLTAAVYWPAWEWGPMGMTTMRYMCASYSGNLSRRDNIRFRRLLTSPEYTSLWGDVFGPSLDQFSIERVSNDKTGWKLATSVGGVGTGERADRVICLPYGEKVLTSDGHLAIGEIVTKRMPVEIAGADKGRIVWQKITNYQRNPPGRLLRIETASGRSLTLTERHRVDLLWRGKTEAKEVRVGDVVFIESGPWLAAEAVSRIDPLSEVPPETFNLTVEPCHNYFANGILVANCDDGNNPLESESPAIMDTTRMWWTEVVPDRLNSLDESAIINIQQRTNEGDISGIILELGLPYDHLCIPMEYDPQRHCVTSIGWQDPRGLDERGNLLSGDALESRTGELAWPERFGRKALDDLYLAKGEYAVSGQYQQLPTPRGGGLFKREWIEGWPPLNPDGSFPDDMLTERGGIVLPALEYVVGWVDTAMTEKQENDFCAMSVIGIFRAEGKGTIVPNGNGTFTRIADDYGYPKAVVIHAWQKRLTIHGPPQEMPDGVTMEQWNSKAYREARRDRWGLVEWVADTVRRYKIDYLGIETQALGHTLQQELARLHMDLPCAVELVPARGDKTARGYAVQGSFSSRQIYFPMFEDGSYPKWLTPLADQLFVFPKGTHDDLVDTLTGGIKHLRDAGLFDRREEFERIEEHAMSWSANKPQTRLPYDI